jgi:hypothetical protein
MKHRPHKIQAMRAFLALLIFIVLPLQFSAAATVKCYGHLVTAQGSPSSHHQKAPTSAAADAGGLAANNVGIDLDCGTCHTNCAAAVTSSSAALLALAGKEQAEHYSERRFLSLHERPDRPQWQPGERRG